METAGFQTPGNSEVVLTLLTCAICDKSFEGRKNRKTCSVECANKLRSKSLSGRTISDESRKLMSEAQKEIYRKRGYAVGCASKEYTSTHSPWNKGLTKETDIRLQKVSESVKRTENDIDWKSTIGKVKSDRISRAKQGIIPWNKGLTKETSTRLAEIGQAISEAYKNTSSEEKERRRLVSRMKTITRISLHPNRYKTNTLPERRFKRLLDILNIKYIQNYPVFGIEHAYPADFYLPDHKMVIEIDGCHWHNFPIGNDIDRVREIELSKIGIFVYRIWDSILFTLEDDIFILEEFLDNCKMDV